MLNNHPDTFTAVQIHLGDAYSTAWGNSRDIFYNVTGTPDAWFDGVEQRSGSVGNIAGQYSYYNGAYTTRRAVSTDVTITLSASPVSGQTYAVQAIVCLEAGGTPKTVRLHMVQVLDNWPTSPTYHRNGFKQAASTQDLDLVAGQCRIVTRQLTFDGDSWGNQADIKIVAWAQETDVSGPSEVYQAGQMAWPFPSSDCNDNGVPDVDDITGGTSTDCDSNAVPDECQDDCNENGTPDACDLIAGTSVDCQVDGTPDECQVAGNDCNSNSTPDDCELSGNDCNENAVPDECDIDGSTSHDCQPNGTPDECETDCNRNGFDDACDLAGATSADCNTNGRPDECDVTRCTSLWDGFLPNPPFSRNRLMNTIDYVPWPGGDGVYWDNPEDTAIVDRRGCDTGASSDQTVKVSVDGGLIDSTDGYLASEYFQPFEGELAPDEEIYALSFSTKIGLGIDSKWDWEFFIHDAESGGRVVQLEFVSYSSLESDVDAGYIMVRNPEWPVGPKFINTNVMLGLDVCYDVEVELNNLDNTVSVYIDGDLKVLTTRMDASARRMDYFHVHPLDNGASSGSNTDIKLDEFGLCLTGLGVSPEEFPDCNANTVLDECDLAQGTSADCNGTGVPDECEFCDHDADADIDLEDFKAFQVCFTGDGGGPVAPGCEFADTDCDDDVDTADHAAFYEWLTGPTG